MTNKTVSLALLISFCVVVGGCSLAAAYTVDPVSNVICNIGQSSASVLYLPTDRDYLLSASGTSYFAPTGIYKEVFVAYQHAGNQFIAEGTGMLESLPIGQSIMIRPDGPVYCFFVEFGDGYTGDNRGYTTVQASSCGQCWACQVDPRNAVVNVATSAAAVRGCGANNGITVSARGNAYFAGPTGAYRSVLVAYQDSDGGNARLRSLEINGGPLSLASDGPVYFFFVEFGSGYLGDNGGGVGVAMGCLTSRHDPSTGYTQNASSFRLEW
jgi:hypothetical protein